jgi:hypothetical protein
LELIFLIFYFYWIDRDNILSRDWRKLSIRWAGKIIPLIILNLGDGVFKAWFTIVSNERSLFYFITFLPLLNIIFFKTKLCFYVHWLKEHFHYSSFIVILMVYVANLSYLNWRINSCRLIIVTVLIKIQKVIGIDELNLMIYSLLLFSPVYEFRIVQNIYIMIIRLLTIMD